jgi:hypothetical protein
MRPLLGNRPPCGRVAAICLLMIVGVWAGEAAGQSSLGDNAGSRPASTPYKDSRLLPGGARIHSLDDLALEIIFQQDVGGSQPSRCAIRRNIVEDVRSFGDDGKRLAHRVLSQTAAMRAFEFGFVRIGDGERSRRIRAFARFRFERVGDGSPLRVERPVWFYDAREDAMSIWNVEPLDADGYGGAWIDVEKLPIDDLGQIVSALMSRPGSTVAVDLPEIGESRAYGIQLALSGGGMGAFVACLCAMRDPHLSDKRVWDCSRR